MELIHISKTKVKLMLSPSDMAHYSGETGAVLREIVSDACVAWGIEKPCGRIFVEMFRSREGGCELFITGLGEYASRLHTGEERTITEYKRYLYRDRKSHVIYAFDCLGYVLSCCQGLLFGGYSGISAVYRDPSGLRYFLKLEKETPVPGENFGSLCPSNIYYYITEHCDVVCGEEAVEKLGKLA